MSFDALVVSLVLGILFLAATTYNNRKHRQYKESVNEALTRGDVAKEGLAQLKIEMAALNEQLSASVAREEGLKATLTIKET